MIVAVLVVPLEVACHVVKLGDECLQASTAIVGLKLYETSQGLSTRGIGASR